MKNYFYQTEQFLPIDINTAWDFFSSPKNLATLTPPELEFKILTQLKDKEFYKGMLIDYRLKPLLGIPVNWQTEIIEVDQPKKFIDKQLKGPYKIWEHTHIFIQQDNGILMKDHLKYALPFGIIGKMAHFLLIKKKIENIFIYRKKILKEIFNHADNTD